VLQHLFMHQTHHRGQAHAMLSGTPAPPPQLDEFLLASDAPLREADLRGLGWSEAQLFPPATSSGTGTSTSSTGTGLQGDYYNTVDLSGAINFTRTDATVNFNWPTSPGGTVGKDYFSVRWTGQVLAQYSETYTFYTQSDDGIQVWVNGQQLINNWTDHGQVENSGTIALVAGQKYDIKVEFYDKTASAIAILSWSSPSTPKAIIPQSQLFPPASAARVAVSSLSVSTASEAQTAALDIPLITVKTGIAPNPVSGGQPVRVNINSTETGPATIQVVNASGNMVYTQRITLSAGLTTSSLPTSGLAKGFYIVNVIKGGSKQTFKMIVQ